MESSLDLAPAVLLAERYRLVERLADGGTASVWRASPVDGSDDVALKILRADGVDPALRERAEREAAVLNGLSHRNLVQVLDHGVESDCPYLVMELIAGESLRHVIAQRAPLPVDEAVALVADVAEGLGAAHDHGVIHRDVKPANIVCARRTGDDAAVPILVDFGIARRIDATTLTRGLVVGTASYLSPEQAQGLPLTPAADVYSLGCVLYELLTGRPPFEGTSPVNVALQHVQQDPVPPGDVADVPPAIDAVLLRCLAKDPDLRPAHGVAMAAALREAVGAGRSDETVAIAVPTVDSTSVMPALPSAMTVTPPPEPRRVPPGLVPVVVVAGIILGILLVGAIGGGGGADADPAPASTTTTAITAPPTTAAPPPAADGGQRGDGEKGGKGRGKDDD